MKELKQIAEELITILENTTPQITEDDKWDYYCALSGYYNDSYYAVTLSRFKGSGDEIEVEYTTNNPLKIVDLIKKIEPKTSVTYRVATTTYKSVTV